MIDAAKNLPPGVAEALADARPTPAPATAAIIPLVQHDVHFLAGGKVRLKSIDLEYPVSFDGREFRTIFVKRLTAAEVGVYFDRLTELRKTDEATVLHFPMFTDEAGTEIPYGLLDALDDDDMERLNEVAVGFLPRRFRATTPEALESETPALELALHPTLHWQDRRLGFERHQHDGLA